MIEFVVSNWDGIIAILLAGHAFALAIVNMTPTPKDNEVVAKVYRVIEIMAGMFSKKAKQ